MSLEKGKEPVLVDVKVEDPHWKVGDGMRDPQGNPDFIIGQLAVVRKDRGKGKPKYDVVFFDLNGQEHGRLHLVEL